MWISDNWTDYELLDCSHGERLERWGERILIRPDPQVIWQTPKQHSAWRSHDARYERSATGGGSWKKNQLPEKWPIRYGDLSFNVSLLNFKHTGLFPEQAINWEYISEKIRLSEKKVNLLNLFSYTGGATLAAAAAGASVCHVDAARGMVMRARENAAISGLQDKPIRWIVEDCTKFIKREIRRGRKYNALIMDPPSYGRGPTGEIWKLEDELYGFLKLCTELLSSEPLFILINSYTTGLAPSSLTYIAQSVFGGQAQSRELGLPVSSTGLYLPCGASCRIE